MARVCYKVQFVDSPEAVEAVAGYAACSLAARYSLSLILFEADSLILVQATKSQAINTSPLGRIYDDISCLLEELPDSSFSHVYRESNMVAHKLARLALVEDLHVFWSGYVPPDLRSFISNNCTS